MYEIKLNYRGIEFVTEYELGWHENDTKVEMTRLPDGEFDKSIKGPVRVNAFFYEKGSGSPVIRIEILDPDMVRQSDIDPLKGVDNDDPLAGIDDD